MMTLQDYINKLKAIEFHTRIKTAEAVAGTYHSAFKGQGMLFSESRSYVEGDDVRYIDWHASARQNALFVKQFVEERELSVCILLDLGPSMRFGSVSRTKAETAIEAMSVLAYSALHNNDRVCLIIFDGGGYKIIPFTKGRNRAIQFILEAIHFEGSAIQNGPCSLDDAFLHAGQLLKRRSIIFAISDFQDKDYEIPLKQLSHRHKLLPIVISDPMESNLPDLGLCLFEDPVTHRPVWCDASQLETRSMFRKRALEREKCQNAVFMHANMKAIRLSTTDDIIKPLTRAFDTRASHG